VSKVDAEEPTTDVLDEDAPVDERVSHPAVPHSTPGESAARGKAARAELPRSAHAGWEPGPSRRDPITLLESQA